MADLERSNAELGRFAFVASHDLKEPLRVISNYVQMLERKNADKLDANSKVYMEFITDATKRMYALINDLLSFSRIGVAAEEREKIDLDEVAKETLANLDAGIRECNATITVGPLPEVNADKGQMIQLFQNLIGNAVKYRKANVPPRVKVEAIRQENGWLFHVTDNGIGIAPEYHEKIFVLFQRLHGREQYLGTGLGLAICRKIVERYGGKIGVESTLGNGATFYFTRPDRPSSSTGERKTT
jgi:light-regulated signal transduction histidine kinase (bacteriophytochrome)